MLSRWGGIRVGRIAGVEVRLDWSVLVVAWLIVMSLGGVTFPARHPDWSPAFAWLLGGVAAVCFFLSILAHELSHAIVGRANGVEVSGITLFIFGGVAQARHEPRSPRAELLMTIVGPLTSLVIGGLALLGGRLLVGPLRYDASDPLQTLARISPLATLLFWLGPLNLMLGLFNLVPAFPLDGGRVLRALLWWTTKDFLRATRWAAGIGQAFGLLLVFLGVTMIFGNRIPLFGRGLVPGLWIAFIGWFLNNAAAASYRRVALRDLMEGVKVAHVMQPSPATVPPELPVSALGDRIIGRGPGAGLSRRRWRSPARHGHARGHSQGGP